VKVELYHTTSELKKLFRKEQNPRLTARIRVVYLALMDKNAPEIGDLLGYSRKTIQNWIYAYNRQGIDDLKESSGRGSQCTSNSQVSIGWLI
jgi:transposase